MEQTEYEMMPCFLPELCLQALQEPRAVDPSATFTPVRL